MAYILVIDDEDSLRKVIKVNLAASGYEVKTAVNGEDGLKAIAKQRPVLIMLDVKMPGMSGFDVLASLRANQFLKDIPVIIMTAFLGGAEEARAREMGAAYLTKPFGVDELVNKVKKSLTIF